MIKTRRLLPIPGKQTVYHSLQSQDDDATPEAIAALDQEVKHYQDQLTELKTREKQARTELATLCARPRLSDLRNDIDQLDREKARLVTRLTELRADNSTQVSPEEKAKVDNEWKLWQKQVNLRRRICYEMWGRCSEVLPEDMTRDELWVRTSLHGLVLIVLADCSDRNPWGLKEHSSDEGG